MMCHPILGYGNYLPRMGTGKGLVNTILLQLNVVFKWCLDTNPIHLREMVSSPDQHLAAPVNHTDAVIIGGSNAKCLQEAFTALGKRVTGLT